MEANIRDLIILGSGPAGLTAAIYSARADLKPLVIEGIQPGGQLTITTEVENFPGYPEGIQGPELMEKFRAQAQRFGAEFIDGEVTRVDLSRRPFRVEVGAQQFHCRALIISTGAFAGWLGLEGEKRLMGKGVSACATCDGFFFKEKEIAVAGGGDTALEEAIFLTRFASKVTVIHRRDKLRASKAMQEKVFRNPKIVFCWDSVIEDILGPAKLEALALKNVKTGQTSQLRVQGLFIAIGHRPNTALFAGQIQLDEKGYIVTQHGTTQTNIAGVFACGDVQDSRYRQAVTAAGSGCMAAIDAERFLEG